MRREKGDKIARNLFNKLDKIDLYNLQDDSGFIPELAAAAISSFTKLPSDSVVFCARSRVFYRHKKMDSPDRLDLWAEVEVKWKSSLTSKMNVRER